MSQVLYRTYRPSTFSEVTGQDHVVKTIQNQYAGKSLAHAYLFTGPRGVGKTTIARLLAKLVNCEDPKGNEPCNTCGACTQITAGQAMDVYEMDAASHTDVENVRETIIQAVRFAPSQLKKKVYIIDEVHMLSVSAFNALLKTIEEPPEYVLFVLATTEIHKVPETIISRCQRFDFKRISVDDLVARLSRIVKEEGVKVDEEVLREIAKHSGGCARDAESLLGQVLALGEKNIGMKEASLVLPATQQVLIEDFVKSLNERDAKTAITQLNTYLEQGVDLHHFVEDVVDYLRDRLLEAIGGKVGGMSVDFLQGAIENLLQAYRDIRGEHIPQLPVELAVVKICGLRDFQKQGADSGRVEISPLPEGGLGGVGVKQEEKVAGATKAIKATNGQEVATAVFDTIPVISLEEVKEKWPQVYEQIKSCNASLPMMMKDCEVSGVEGGQVEIGFDYDLYVQTVNQEKNRSVIEGVLEKVLGKRVRVKAVQKAHKDEVVDELVEAFGGSAI
jgi:DNA polymerase-3 subunit gamma/tau